MSKYLLYIVLIFLGFAVWGFSIHTNGTFHNTSPSLDVLKINQKSTNIYAIKTNGKYLLIDSGRPNSNEQLIKELKENNISPSAIDYLILTHAHPDHAGNAFFFQQNFGTKIIAGKGDNEIIMQNGKDTLLCPTGLIGKLVENTIAKEKYEAFDTDIQIEQPFDLKQIGLAGQIIPMPGHTPGSLMVKIENSVFVGDIIKGQMLNKDKPARHIFVCDYGQNLMNIEKIAALEDVAYWYPGHGGPLRQEDVKKFIDKENLK